MLATIWNVNIQGATKEQATGSYEPLVSILLLSFIAICCCLSVCLSSVGNARAPYSGGRNFYGRRM